MESVMMKNKVVIITGGNSGLGKAAAVDLARRGCRLLLTARDLGRLEETKRLCVEAGLVEGEVVVVQGDITQGETRREVVHKAMETFGRIDVLVNNAGTMPLGFFKDMGETDFDHAIDVNVKACVFMAQAALPHLIHTKGCVINISSCLASANYPGALAYAVSKCALDMATKGIAIETGQVGVRVNSINPGIVLTDTLIQNVKHNPMYAHSADPYKEFVDKHSKQHALQRCAQTQEVTDVIAFLASEAASFITGQTIYVDGGSNALYHRQVDTVFPSYDEMVMKD